MEWNLNWKCFSRYRLAFHLLLLLNVFSFVELVPLPIFYIHNIYIGSEESEESERERWKARETVYILLSCVWPVCSMFIDIGAWHIRNFILFTMKLQFFVRLFFSVHFILLLLFYHFAAHCKHTHNFDCLLAAISSLVVNSVDDISHFFLSSFCMLNIIIILSHISDLSNILLILTHP